MGMSGDFAAAIAAGSTLVRIGTALFGRMWTGEDRKQFPVLQNRRIISCLYPWTTATTPPDANRQEALRRLLDDTSASVRQALLVHFTELGPAAAPFLREIAQGSDAELARHAAWFLQELKFSDPVAEFRGFIRSLNYELETGALLLARTVSPRLDIGRCCTALDRIAARCRELIAEPSTRREKCRVLNRVLFHEWGFRGNVEHYTDPRNSLIDEVLARRTGIPISLSTVYLLVAGRIGLDLEPVGLSGHFVVGSYGEGAPFSSIRSSRGSFAPARISSRCCAPQDRPPGERSGAESRARGALPQLPQPGRITTPRPATPAHAQLFASFIEEFEAAYARNVE